MTEEAKAARRAYKRAWNKANPEKVRQHQETYWTKKAAQDAADPAPGEDQSGAAGEA